MSEVMDETDVAFSFGQQADETEAAEPEARSVEVGADPVTDAGSADPAAPAVEPAAPAAPTWIDSPEYQDALAEARQEAQQTARAEFQAFLQELAANEQQPDQERPALDPFGDDFGDQLAGLLSQRDEQLLGQFRQLLQPLLGDRETKQIAEGEERAKDIVADLEQRNGKLPGDKSRGAVPMIAELFLGEAQQRFGRQPRAGEYAISRAEGFVRDIVAETKAWAVEQYKAELAAAAGAKGEPSAVGAAVNVHGDAEDEMDVAARWGAESF